MSTYDAIVEEDSVDEVIVQPVEHHYAGFWMRFWAYSMDIILLSGISGMLLSPLSFIEGGEPLYLSVWTVNTLVAGLIYHLYFILMTKFFGQTLGKMVMGLKVIPDKEESLTWLDVMFREGIGRLIQRIFMGMQILYLIVAFTNEKQGIHDMIGHTRVVHVETLEK